MCAGLSYIWVLFIADNSYKLAMNLTDYVIVICCFGNNRDFLADVFPFIKNIVSKHIIVCYAVLINASSL